MSREKYQNSRVADKDAWVNFDSEECELDRQQYLNDSHVELTQEQQMVILKYLLALLPNRYKNAQFKLTVDKGWIHPDVPEYKLELRYEKLGEIIQDTFVFKGTHSTKIERRMDL